MTDSGFLSNLTPQDARDGALIKFTLNVEKMGGIGGAGAAKGIKGNTQLKFRGGVIASIGAAVNTGSLEVSETVTINFADLIAEK